MIWAVPDTDEQKRELLEVANQTMYAGLVTAVGLVLPDDLWRQTRRVFMPADVIPGVALAVWSLKREIKP